MLKMMTMIKSIYLYDVCASMEYILIIIAKKVKYTRENLRIWHEGWKDVS